MSRTDRQTKRHPAAAGWENIKQDLYGGGSSDWCSSFMKERIQMHEWAGEFVGMTGQGRVTDWSWWLEAETVLMTDSHVLDAVK